MPAHGSIADVEAAVRDVVETAAAEFLVDIVYEDFILRLALHVQNLQHRAREQAWSRNPLTRSLKSTYPMIFEVAVFIASRLQERLGIPLPDDEIAYIAMHVGGRLERSRHADQLLTATIVCPGYYDLHELLRSSVDRSLGPGDRGRRSRDADRPRLGLHRHRPRADDDRSRRCRRSGS